MAELSTGQPLFPGDSDIDQLYIVQKMLGECMLPAHHNCANTAMHAMCLTAAIAKWSGELVHVDMPS